MNEFDRTFYKLITEEYYVPGVEAEKFKYMMLGRLQSDCEYFIEHPRVKYLWAGSVDAQIAEMKKRWNEFAEDKKPEWLTLDQIDEYERKMKEAEALTKE